MTISFGQLSLLRPEVKDYSPPTVFPSIGRAKRITLDLETHDPDLLSRGPGWRRNAYVVGIGINADNVFKEYYPIAHLYGENCDPEKVWSWLRAELNNYTGEICGANVNLYDGDGLQQNGVKPWKAKWHDIQWAEPLLDEHAFSFSLDTLAEKYLGKLKQTEGLEEMYGPDWKKQIREIHPQHIRNYVFGDINLPGAILDKQMVALKAERLTKLYDLESRLCPLLLYMRNKGVPINMQGIEKLHGQFLDKITELQERMNKMIGFPVNYRPSKSFFSALDSLQIKYPILPPTEKDRLKGRTEGRPSATDHWIKSVDHPFMRLLTRLRRYDKINGTFIEGYMLENNIKGRIHAEFHPLKRADEEGSRGTISGRFSSSNPNLQNIPVKNKLAKLIRENFIPDDGRLWWSKDYSQAEFRLLVHYAVKAKCHGADIAQKMYQDNPDTDFHVMVSELTGLARKPAKNLNFGLVYGMGKAKLAKTLGVDDIAAAEIMEIYHGRAPFIKELFNKAMHKAQTTGFVKTILGRKGRFNEMEKKFYGEGMQRAHTHKALNIVLQGSCGDLLKTSMVGIWEAGLIAEDFDLYLTEHDELDGAVIPGKIGEEKLAEVSHIMENAIKLEVPIKVDSGVGANWAEAH